MRVLEDVRTNSFNGATTVGLNVTGSFFITPTNVQAVVRILNAEKEAIGVGIYFTENFNEPDLILMTSGTEETEDTINQLETASRRSTMRVVK